MWWAGPAVAECRPVISVNREGAQTGASQYAASYRMPSAARRSIVGVRATGSPYAPMYGAASSLMNHRMFGRPRSGSDAGADDGRAAASDAAAPAAPPARNERLSTRRSATSLPPQALR
jgi:hypothetical protein